MPTAQAQTADEKRERKQKPKRRRQPAYPQHLMDAIEEGERMVHDDCAPCYDSVDEMNKAILLNNDHPGEALLHDYMWPLEVSAEELAAAIKVPVDAIKEITRERSGVTPDIAARLARYFGTTDRYWLDRQVEYDLEVVHRDKAEELAAIVPWSPDQSGENRC